MLDRDLATIYGVTTKRLNEQVRRNLQRFPEDFAFRLTQDEAVQLDASRPQFATLKRGRNIKYLPYAFTEHGAVMLASVLNSPVAVEASLHVVRAFIRLRSLLASHQELARRIDDLEKDCDTNFKIVFDAIHQLMGKPPEEPPSEEPAKNKIGFHGGQER